MKRSAWMLAITLALLLLPLSQAHAVIIDFENFAPAGSLVNISPGSTYSEDGFTLTPTDAQSAVFDSAAFNTMLGNDTDWFGFAESNTPTLTLTSGGSPFLIQSVLIGPSTIAASIPINMTIVGNLNGGGSVMANFSNLNTAMTAVLNWGNLISVDFITSDDAGLDDINVSVPEPSTLALLLLGSVGLSRRRRRR